MKNSTRNRFTQVEYRQFRQILSQISLGNTGDHGTDTFICDQADEVQAVVQAASIDVEGRCHPARYYVNTMHFMSDNAVAA